MDEESRIPSEKELTRLPLLAMVAFAARCARRVQPLFQDSWTGAPPNHDKAMESAISYAEGIAARKKILDIAAHTVAFTVLEAAEANASVNAPVVAKAVEAADHALRAAGYVANRAAHDLDKVRSAVAWAAATAADIAAKAAEVTIAARTTEAVAYAAAIHPIRRDYNFLLGAARKGNWGDSTPVPPEFFGPLWPEGEPKGWPSKKAIIGAGGIAWGGECKVVFPDPPLLTILVDSDVDKELFAEFLAELASLYSELSGGDELIIRDGKTPAPVEVTA